jgi:hypothetical protein
VRNRELKEQNGNRQEKFNILQKSINIKTFPRCKVLMLMFLKTSAFEKRWKEFPSFILHKL